MKTMTAKYDECLTNLTNSILKYFEIDTYHNSLDYLDNILEDGKYKNIVLVLCDGMGTSILNNALGEDTFFRKNKYKDISSVFPSTTTAATTSLITGLNPNEHCWLGWENYVKELNEVIVMFRGNIKDTDTYLSNRRYCYDYFKYTNIFTLINSNPKYKATWLSPYEGTIYSDIDDMCNRIKGLCGKKEKNYIYAYLENPDMLMHKFGTNHEDVISNINMINSKIEKLSNELEDTLLIITADHGHINSSYFYLDDYPDLFNLLIRNTSIDSRASMLFVKDGYQNEFKELFSKYFNDNFILLSKQEILEQKIFGIGNNNELFNSCLGDFIAISIKDKNIKYQHYGSEKVSTHSGITEDEMVVPLILKKIKKETIYDKI